MAVQCLLLVLAMIISSVNSHKCYRPVDPTKEPKGHVISALPRNAKLPRQWDWRNVRNQSFVSNVLSQQNPNVCGSCWAEAATGALSDRYRIYTNGVLQVNLAVQVLLNYDPSMSGGSCMGGDDYKAAEFIHKYGISDDTCAPFSGVDFAWGFDCCDGTDTSKKNVQSHMCHSCNWVNECDWITDYERFGADEYGKVLGEEEMKQEIYARGPIACSLDSGPDAFDQYTGGVITEEMLPEPSTDTDHVVVIAGWGEDEETGLKWWAGRNSYGTRWGETGWFRLQRGNNTLALEQGSCSWAVPAKKDVDRVLQTFHPAPSYPI